MATLAGCATPYSQGLVAARQGRYVDASVLYEQALARDPDRLDAIVQLGIVRYKLGALDGAIELLERARSRAPAEPTVRLFLALAYLRKNNLALADEHLTTFVALKPDRRVATQAERTIAMIRSEPLSEPTRAFVAASLENAAELAEEADAWRALESERLYFWGPYPYPPAPFPGCGYVWRGGWLRCY
jgi:tetratricopeptide (TPR) repeat protein